MGWRAPPGGRRRRVTRLRLELFECVEAWRAVRGLSFNAALEQLLETHPDMNSEDDVILTVKTTSSSNPNTEDDVTLNCEDDVILNAGGDGSRVSTEDQNEEGDVILNSEDDVTLNRPEGSRTYGGRPRAKRNTYIDASDIDRRGEASGPKAKREQSNQNNEGQTDRLRKTSAREGVPESVGQSVEVPVLEILSLWDRRFVLPWNGAEPDRCRALALRRKCDVKVVLVRQAQPRPSTALADLLACTWSTCPDLDEWASRFEELAASPYLVRELMVRDLFDVLRDDRRGAAPSYFEGLRVSGRYRPRPGNEYHRETQAPTVSEVASGQVSEEVTTEGLVRELYVIRRMVSKGLAEPGDLERASAILDTLPVEVAGTHRASFEWATKQAEQGA